MRPTLFGLRQSTSFRSGLIVCNIPVIAGQQDADPGSVAFDGIQAAVARNVDIVLVDTAGRLHTRYNLMEELKKVQRVIGKAMPGAPHATWLVLDAATGQNAIAQARAFMQAVQITGIILAKLDTSAKGGMAFAIQRQLKVPILYAGLGETADSLELFDREAFVDGILEGFQTDLWSINTWKIFHLVSMSCTQNPRHYWSFFDLPARHARIEILQKTSEDPDFWKDNERAQKVMRELSELREEVIDWEKYIAFDRGCA